jgi:tight adherence protein B
MIPFFVFIAILFLTYAVYLLMTRKSEGHKEEYRKRLADAVLYSSQSTDPDVSLAREDLLSEIPWFNRMLLNFEFTATLKKIIEQSDLNITVMRLILISGLAGTMAALAASMVTYSLVIVGASGLLASVLPFGHILWTRKRRLNSFLEQLPEALDLMSRALASGHAFQEALHMVSTEMPDPLASEFRKTFDEQNLGLSVKLALENLSRRIPLLDLKLCVTAIMIQRETGGNLAEILEKVAHTIRERFRIMEDLKTLTTSSRMSAWILCGIPIFIAIVVTIMDPEYMQVLWNDPRGHNILYLAIGMQITGMLVVRKILNIKI